MNFKKYTLVTIHHLLINSPKYQEKKRNNVINKCNKRSSDPISQFKAVMNYLIKRVCKRFSWCSSDSRKSCATHPTRILWINMEHIKAALSNISDAEELNELIEVFYCGSLWVRSISVWNFQIIQMQLKSLEPTQVETKNIFGKDTTILMGFCAFTIIFGSVFSHKSIWICSSSFCLTLLKD